MRWKQQKKVIEEQVVLPYVPNAYWLDNGDLLLSSNRVVKRSSYRLTDSQDFVDAQVETANKPYYWDDPDTGLAQLPSGYSYEVVKLDTPETVVLGGGSFGLLTDCKYAILVKNPDGDEVSHRAIKDLNKKTLHEVSLLSAQDAWSAIAAANDEAKYLGTYPPKEI